MNGTESIEDFYRLKLDHVPENLRKEIGHFNVFKVDDYVGRHARPIPYSRRDYYKITLIKGRNRYHYADKTVEIKNAALLFANPMIPYNWEPLDDEQTGSFCIFTQDFFNSFGSIKEYPIFQPGNTPLYELSDPETAQLQALFDQMFTEINSSYAFKYDLIRTLVIQLIHTAIKLQPAEITLYGNTHANDRITALFADLLERQFLIESPLQRMKLRSPADFAANLSVHINHLNRSLKSVTGKTTSQLIAERILQEARVLLKHTDWNVSQIGYCLGFDEPSHFITFFRKNVFLTPKAFRESPIV
jgi:AraC family transcriptional regulator, transcriptional activator of pobA